MLYVTQWSPGANRVPLGVGGEYAALSLGPVARGVVVWAAAADAPTLGSNLLEPLTGRSRAAWIQAGLPPLRDGLPLGAACQACLTELADPTGVAGPRPIVPDKDGRARIRIGPHRHTFAHSPRANDAATAPFFAMLRTEYVRRRNAEGVAAALKYLGEHAQKYRLKPAELGPFRDRDDGPPRSRGTLVSEVFGYSLGTLSTSWSPAWSGYRAVKANGAAAATTNTVGDYAHAVHPTVQAVDHECRATLSGPDNANDAIGPLVRGASGGFGYYGYKSGTNLVLGIWHGGGLGNLAVIAFPAATPAELFVSALGSTITVAVNGVQAIQVTNTTNATQTLPGIFGFHWSGAFDQLLSAWRGGGIGETAGGGGGGGGACGRADCGIGVNT